MKGSWTWKKFLALFMAVAMVMVSGIFVTTQSFKATDSELYGDETTEDVDAVEDETEEDGDASEEESYDESEDISEEETAEEETGDSAEDEEAVSDEEAAATEESDAEAVEDAGEGAPEETAEGAPEETAEGVEAQPETKSVKVVYDINLGEGEVPDETEVEVSADGRASVDLPDLPDYTDGNGATHSFVGWNTEPEATEAQDDITVGADDGEISLYAIWKLEEPVAAEAEVEAEQKTEEQKAAEAAKAEADKAAAEQKAAEEKKAAEEQAAAEAAKAEADKAAAEAAKTEADKAAAEAAKTETDKTAENATAEADKAAGEKTKADEKAEETAKADADKAAEQKAAEEQAAADAAKAAAEATANAGQKVDEEGYALDANGNRILGADGKPIKADDLEALLLAGVELTDEQLAALEAQKALLAQQMEQMPEGSASGTAGNVSVEASWEVGVFPAGTKMQVSSVSKEDAMAAIEGKVEGATEAYAVDITFVGPDGNEVQPADNGKVSVSMSLNQPLMGQQQTLVHVDDGGNVSEVSADVSETGADFDAESFSIYVLVGNGEDFSNFTNRQFDYSIEAYQELTLAENAKNAKGEYLGGEWKIVSNTAITNENGENKETNDLISFMDNANLNPETGTEQPKVEIETSGKGGNAVVTYTYKVTDGSQEKEVVDTYTIHIKGYTVHFDLNGGSGEVKDQVVGMASGGSTLVQLPSGAGLTRAGYNFKGWTTNKDAMTANRRFGWYDPVYGGDDSNAATLSDMFPISNKEEQYTLYAAWAPNDNYAGQIGFFIRDDGTIQTEPASYSSSFYTTVTPGGQYYKAVSDLTDYISEVYTETNVDNIGSNGGGPKITAKAWREVNDEINKNHKNLLEKFPGLTSEGGYYITWYVVKDQGSWHVDGVIRGSSDGENGKVNLDYNPNCKDYTGQCPVGKQYTKGKSVTVEGKNTIARKGYVFSGWNTKTDGSGLGYKEGDTITLKENTTLYAQWIPSNETPYTLQCFDTETKAKISDQDRVRYGTTGNTVKADEVDKTLPGYVFDEGNPDNVLKSQIKADGSTTLILWFNPGHNVKVNAVRIGKLYDGVAVTDPLKVDNPTAQQQTGGVYVDNETVPYQKADGNIKFTYKGKEYVIEGVSVGLTQNGQTVNEAKNAGEYKAVITKNDARITQNGKKTAFTLETNDGYVNITKRVVTVTSATLSKEYDGKALENGDKLEVKAADGLTINPQGAITGDGFIESDKLEWSFTGSQKVPGESPNTFAAKDQNKFNELNNTNYSITLVQGKLIVNSASAKYQINVRAKDIHTTYGKDYSVGSKDYVIEGVKVTEGGNTSLLSGLGAFFSNESTESFQIGQEDFTISGLSTAIVGGKKTDAGTYKEAIAVNGDVVVKQDGKNVSGQFEVHAIPGTITIDKAVVNLKSKDLEKKYDGKDLVNGNEKLETETGWVGHEGADYTFTGKQRNVGSSKNTFSYTLKNGVKADNYDIRKDEGSLTVKAPDGKVDVTVTPKGSPDPDDSDNKDDDKDNNDDNDKEDQQSQAGNSPNSATFLYDGTEKTVTGFVEEEKELGLEVVGNNNEKYYVSGLTAVTKATDAGKTKVVPTGEIMVRDEDGNDVTQLVNVNIADAYLVINKRTVVMHSASLVKPYDGSFLMNPGEAADNGTKTTADTLEVTAQAPIALAENGQGTITGDGFANGEGAVYTFTGRQKLEGESKNSFTYVLKENTKAANYNITALSEDSYGTLTVGGLGEGQKIGVTVEAESAVVPAYDGQEHGIVRFKDQAEDGSITVTLPNGNTYTIKDLEITGLKKEGSEGEGAAEGAGVTEKVKDAGTYKTVTNKTNVKVFDSEHNDVTGQFDITVVEGTLVIGQATVNVRSADLSKVYDGNELKNPEGQIEVVADDVVTIPENGQNGSVTGFAPGEGATYSFKGTQTVVGSSPNEFEVTLNNGTKAANYNIVPSFGTLTVTNRGEGDLFTVEVKALGGEFVYDGQPHTVSGFEKQTEKGIRIEEGGKTYYVSGYESTATAKDVTTGESAQATDDEQAAGDEQTTESAQTAGGISTTITGTPVVTDEKGNDVSAQFAVVPIPGKLVITKRPVTLKSATLQKVYKPKEPLTNVGDKLKCDEAEAKEKGITIVENGGVEQGENQGWAGDEGVTYAFSGRQKVVGTSSNAFTYTAKPGTDLNNYTIDKQEGTLTVLSAADGNGNKAFTVVVTAKSIEPVLYDKNDHAVSGFIDEENGKITVEADGDTYYVTGLSTKLTKNGKDVETAVDAGVYSVVGTGTPEVRDAENNNVTDQFNVQIVPGTVTVNPRNVTIRTATLAKEYDGKPLTNGGNDIIVAAAEGVTIDPQGEIGGDGFASGDEPKWKFTGSQKAPGESSNTFEALNADKYKALKDSGNYVINEEIGKLKVNNSNAQYEIKVQANNITAKYDGKSHGAKNDDFTLVGVDSESDSKSLLSKLGDFVTGGSTTQFSIGDEVFTISGLKASGEETNAGTYKDRISIIGKETIKDAQGNDVTGQFLLTKIPGTLTIDPVKLTMKSASLTKEYDGNPLLNGDEPIQIIEGDWVGSDNASYTFTNQEGQTLVGVSQNTFAYNLMEDTEASNYDIHKVEGTLTVTNRSENSRYEVTITPKGSASTGEDTIKYDGTKHEINGFVDEVDGKIPVRAGGHIYYVSGYSAHAEGVHAGTYPVEVTTENITVTDKDGKDVKDNFIVHVSEGASLVITRRSIGFRSASLQKDYDGRVLENPQGQLKGVSVSDPVKLITDGDITGDGFAGEEGKGVSFVFKATQKLVGYTPNTFEVDWGSVKKANYEIAENDYGTLTVKPLESDKRLEVSIRGNSNAGDIPVYDGQPHTVSGFEGQTDKGVPVTKDGQTYYVSGVTSQKTLVNATETEQGTNNGVATEISGNPIVKDEDGNDVTDQFDVKVIPGEIYIARRPLRLVSADVEKYYDGKPLTNGETPLAEETGWVNGQGATYVFTGSRTLEGFAANAFTVTANGDTKLDNYMLSKTEGKLTVKGRSDGDKLNAKIQAKSGKFEYNGKEQSVSGFENQTEKGVKVTVGGVDYYVTGVTSAAAQKDATGKEGILTKIDGKPEVKDAEGNDVTGQFDVDPEQGTLIITPKELELRSADLTKEYDGKELTNGDEPLAVEKGWVDGEGATYRFTGRQRTVGGSENAFGIVPNSGTELKNYDCHKTEGTLTVTQPNALYELTVTVRSDEVTYDGKPHKVEGFVDQDEDGRIPVKMNGDTYYVSDLKTVVSGGGSDGIADAGEYTVIATGTPHVTDSDGADVTKQFNVKVEKGTLTIKKRDITLKSVDRSKEYDGYPLTNGDGVVEVTDSLNQLKESSFNIKFTGSQTQIGSSKNEFTASLKSGDEKNYAITTVFGTLTVTGNTKNIDPAKVMKKTHEGGDKIFKIGDTVEYTITVKNIYADARNITINEMPGVEVDQANFENVPGGETVKTKARYTITEEDVIANSGKFINKASATISGGNDPGGTFDAEDPVIIEQDKPSIAIYKTSDSRGSVRRVGETVNYVIKVVNNGNVKAENIHVTDELTGESWDVAALNAGASKDFTTAYTIKEEDALNGKVINKATVTGTGGGNEIKNETEETVTVNQEFKLVIHYTDKDGNPVAADYVHAYKFGDSFYVESPSVAGYTPVLPFVTGDKNGMPSKDVEVTVTYVKNETLTGTNSGTPDGSATASDDSDDDKVVKDGNRSIIDRIMNRKKADTTGKNKTRIGGSAEGPADDTTQVDGGSEAPGNVSGGTGRTTGSDNGDETSDGRRKGGGYITIGKDGKPKLVAADDMETPLFNLGLDDHACNILRLLILLAAFGFVVAHTRSMRRHQSRIFELREKLDNEKRH